MDGNKDEDLGSLERTGSRVDKLIPKVIKAKRRRRKEKEKERARDAELSGQEDDARSHSASGRRLVNRESTLDSDDTSSTGNVNVADDNEQDDRSFESFSSTTDRSNIELGRPAPSSAPVRPATISTHPSLIGYLTTSSPAVQAAHLSSQVEASSPANASRRSDRSGDNSPSRPGRTEPAKGTSPAQPAILEPPAAAKIAGADRRGRASTPKLETRPPRTPPRDDNAGPVIVNTPPTPTDHAEATFSGSPDRKSLRNGAGTRGSPEIGPPVVNMSVHRRTKSGSAVNSPSKLSNIMAPPLTPTDEQTEGTPSTGFFSSMISAAQNAASQISSNMPATGLGIGGNKSRSSLNKVASSTAPSQTDVGDTEPEQDLAHVDDDRGRQESAIRTLGSGDLSLDQLGLVEAPTGTVVTPAAARFPDIVDSRARSESAPADPHTREGDIAGEESLSRPRSIAEPASGEQTLPQMEYADIKAGVNRSSSMRSAMKPHRKRGSSVTTGVTVNGVAAAIPTSTGIAGAPKLTGFAIASKKRNRDFHNLFKSVPDDDYLIEDYSCALQREILAHGRLYVSEGHLCFSSNILGWTTTLVMSFDEIVSVEKRSTALVFKNGLMISTLHAKHIFASFTSRDGTYDLIVNIWKLGHPTLKSTLNGVQLEGTGGDKTEKIDTEPEANGEEDDAQESSSDEESEEEEEDDDDFYDEEEHGDVVETQSTDMTAVEPEPEKPATRKISTALSPNMTAADSPKELAGSPGPADFPRPPTHAPTDCGDAPSHYEKILGDEIIAAPLGKVYTLLFGPASPGWMSKWLATDQKCTDIQMDDKKGLTLDNRNRTYTYIKPLNGSIGPRQTKCVTTEMVEQIDLEKSVNLSVSTTTPDVPYGNLFTTKTKYCLSWAENNATRVQITNTVEWSGKCWLKGTIEKNVNEGQAKHNEDLFASLKAAVSTRGRSGTGTGLGAGTGKGKKKLKRSKTQQSTENLASSKAGKGKPKKTHWGPLEPVRGIAEPLVDFVRPVLTGNVMYGLLVGLLVSMWFGFGSNAGKGVAPFGPDSARYSPSRAAAYDEMWRREDSELWEWLEERVGIDRLSSSNSAPVRRKVMDPRTVEEKLREERMDEREVEEAIRVTEEKLQVLRKVVGKD